MRETLLTHLEHWRVRAPVDDAVRQDDVVWSIARLLDESARVADALQRLGVVPGDRVAWWGASTIEFATLLLATWRLDATYVGIHSRYTAREVVAVLARVEPRVVIHADDPTPWSEGPPAIDPSWTHRLRAFRSLAGGTAAAPLSPPTGTHPALIVFTTGSTGSPKAAVLSHVAVAAASESQAAATTCGSRSTLNTLPANHIGGLVNITTSTWWAGECVEFVPVFSPAAIIEALRRTHGVRLAAVPTVFRRCLDDPGFATAAHGTLVHALSGGAPLPRAVYDALTTLGVKMQGMYGQTEMTGSICFTALDDDAAASCDTIGRPHPSVTVRLGPLDGSDGGEGDAGELQVRGEQVFDGYYNDPAATRAAFTDDGWLRSGDIALRRPNGALQLTGRLKDIISTRGYKVMPREIEDVLLEHPDIASTAVVGAPDAAHGEIVVAFVTPQAGATVTIGDLAPWCRERLAHYKIPRRFIVLDTLPLLGVGKIDRRRLTDELTRGFHG